LVLMPDWLRTVAVVLPFRTAMGFPVELLMGRLDARQTVSGFAVGLGWLAVFALLYRIGWRHGVRRYQAVAG
jgi:ABC-2 type transport system permease protein